MRNEFENETPDDIEPKIREKSSSGWGHFFGWSSETTTKSLRKSNSGTVNDAASAPLPSIHEELKEDKEKPTIILSGAMTFPFISPVKTSTVISIMPVISQLITDFLETTLYKKQNDKKEKNFPLLIFKNFPTLKKHFQDKEKFLQDSDIDETFLLTAILRLMQTQDAYNKNPQIDRHEIFTMTYKALLNKIASANTKTKFKELCEKLLSSSTLSIVIEDECKKIFQGNSSVLSKLIPLFLREVRNVLPGFLWQDFLDTSSFELACERNQFEPDLATKAGYLSYLLKDLLRTRDHCLKYPAENHFDYFKIRIQDFTTKCKFEDVKAILSKCLVNFVSQDVILAEYADSQRDEIYYSRNLQQTKILIDKIIVGIPKIDTKIKIIKNTLFGFTQLQTENDWEIFQTAINMEIKDNILLQWVSAKLATQESMQLNTTKSILNKLPNLKSLFAKLTSILTEFLKQHKKTNQANLYYKFHETLAKFIREQWSSEQPATVLLLVEFSESIKNSAITYIRPKKTLFYSGKATAEKLSVLTTALEKLGDDDKSSKIVLPCLNNLLVSCNQNPTQNYFYITQNLMRALASYLPESLTSNLISNFITDYNEPFSKIKKLLHKIEETVSEKLRKEIEKEIEAIANKGIYIEDCTSNVESLRVNSFLDLSLNFNSNVNIATNDSLNSSRDEPNLSFDNISLKIIPNNFVSKNGTLFHNGLPISPVKHKANDSNLVSQEEATNSESEPNIQVENMVATELPVQPLPVNLLRKAYLTINNPQQPSEIASYNAKLLYRQLLNLHTNAALTETETSLLQSILDKANRVTAATEISFQDFEKLFEISSMDEIETGALYKFLTNFKYRLITEEVENYQREVEKKLIQKNTDLLIKELTNLLTVSEQETKRKDTILEQANILLQQASKSKGQYERLFDVPENITEVTPLERYLRGFKYLNEHNTSEQISTITLLYNKSYRISYFLLQLFNLYNTIKDNANLAIFNTLQYEAIFSTQIGISDNRLFDPKIIIQLLSRLTQEMTDLNIITEYEKKFKAQINIAIKQLHNLSLAHIKIYQSLHSDGERNRFFLLNEFLSYFKDFSLVNLLQEKHLLNNTEQPAEIVSYNLKLLHEQLLNLPKEAALTNAETKLLTVILNTATKIIASTKISFQDFKELFEISARDKAKIKNGPLYKLLTSFNYRLMTEEMDANLRRQNVGLLKSELEKLLTLFESETQRKHKILEDATTLLEENIISEKEYRNLFSPADLTARTPLERYLLGFKYLIEHGTSEEISSLALLYNNAYRICYYILQISRFLKNLKNILTLVRSSTPEIDSALAKFLTEKFRVISSTEIHLSDNNLFDPTPILELISSLKDEMNDVIITVEYEKTFKTQISSAVDNIIKLSKSHIIIYEKFSANNAPREVFTIANFLSFFEEFSPIEVNALKGIPNPEHTFSTEDLPSVTSEKINNLKEEEEEEEEEKITPADENNLESFASEEAIRLQTYKKSEWLARQETVMQRIFYQHTKLALDPNLRHKIKNNPIKIEFFYNSFHETLAKNPDLHVKKLINDFLYYEMQLKNTVKKMVHSHKLRDEVSTELEEISANEKEIHNYKKENYESPEFVRMFKDGHLKMILEKINALLVTQENLALKIYKNLDPALKKILQSEYMPLFTKDDGHGENILEITSSELKTKKDVVLKIYKDLDPTLKKLLQEAHVPLFTKDDGHAESILEKIIVLLEIKNNLALKLYKNVDPELKKILQETHEPLTLKVDRYAYARRDLGKINSKLETQKNLASQIHEKLDSSLKKLLRLKEEFDDKISSLKKIGSDEQKDNNWQLQKYERLIEQITRFIENCAEKGIFVESAPNSSIGMTK